MTSKENDSFEKVVSEIQASIQEEENAIYSKKVVEEYHNPQNVGRIIDPDGFAIITGPCGDTMELYINVKNGSIREINFMTDGCGPSIACGSMATRLANSKTLDEAMKIINLNILDALDGLPEENIHCAKLAADTLHKAILNCLEEIE